MRLTVTSPLRRASRMRMRSGCAKALKNSALNSRSIFKYSNVLAGVCQARGLGLAREPAGPREATRLARRDRCDGRTPQAPCEAVGAFRVLEPGWEDWRSPMWWCGARCRWRSVRAWNAKLDASPRALEEQGTPRSWVG